MCMLIALHRCVAGAPLVVAANRDEYLDRPAEPPALRWAVGRVVAAPLDRRAGGTWLGLNGAGLFAAVTNRPCATPDPARRSRGLLVLDALGASEAAAAAEALCRLPERAYNPFNLFVADGRDAFAVVYEDAPRLMELGAGAHVVANADPDDRNVPKVSALLSRAEEAAAGPAGDVLSTLEGVCRGHDGATALESACVHTPRYGTRSSTLMRLSDDAGEGEWRYAPGPPCETGYRDFTPLLRELRRSARARAGERAERTAS